VSKDGDEIVFDPRVAVETEPRLLSARVAALNGLRLGVLDNTKWNAGRLLRKIAAKLHEEYALTGRQLLPQGKLLQGGRSGIDRDDRRQ